MLHSYTIIVLLCISRNVLGHWILLENIDYDHGFSYQEIINMNASCYPLDSCMEDRTDDRAVPTFNYTCSCHRQCWEFGTCCIDSPYRDMSSTQKCRDIGGTLYRNGYYIVDRCPGDINTDSTWKNECEKEWDGEDNILLLSPVTSLDTALTYKNFFCFKCHETTDKYVYWYLFVESIYSVSGDINVSSVAYDQELKSWMAVFDENHISIPANLSFVVPYNLQVQPVSCDLDMISDCSYTWTDRLVREKCLAYTAIVYREYSSYKNVHCALCNYESLGDLTCTRTSFGGRGGKDKFSFRNLLDINSSSEDRVGNDEKCDNDHTWDPYGKKCRKKTCALPGYVIKNDKCAPP